MSVELLRIRWEPLSRLQASPKIMGLNFPVETINETRFADA
ncbi:MAG TPA: hypothetical protein VKM55_08180 [Candidatus Lokiarchaeia archaeon]|nr:hypothetical protein [Candidatus Lokiarchaeia archaeon]